MSLVRQFVDQTRETFLAMPMPSRVISVMLVVAISLGLGMLVRGGSKPSMEPIFGGRTLAERELDAIERAFGQADLKDWKRVGRRIEIPVENRNEYYSALGEVAGLPRSLQTYVQKAIEQSNIFEPTDLRRMREMHAKELDLGKRIEAFPDVRYASVEYDIGERLGLGRKRSQSASVLVEPEGFDALPRNRIAAIKDLVRASYADMTLDDVTVIDTNSPTTDRPLDDSDMLRRRQLQVEADYVQKVRTLLRPYGEIRVVAFADIDPTMDAEKATLKYDEQPTTIGESSRKIESETNRPLNGGVPGTATNVTQNRPVSLEDLAQTSKKTEDERQSTKIAGQQYEQSKLASLQTRRVRISVGLPDSYYRKVWANRNPGQDPSDPADRPADFAEQIDNIKRETADDIKNAVTPILPDISAGEDRFDQLVEVWDYDDLPEPVVAESKATERALTWLAESWQTIALFGLGLVALLVARSAARVTSDDRPPADFQEGFGLELPTPPAPTEQDEDGNDSMTITGSSLKDELVSLVEKNPEVAANVIRGWVGEAA